MKIKRDVITSITASLVAVTLVIMCVVTFITDVHVIVFIGNVIMCLLSVSPLVLKMSLSGDQRKNV
jgi:hypothetical protein